MFLFAGSQIIDPMVWVISADNQFSITGRFKPPRGVKLAMYWVFKNSTVNYKFITNKMRRIQA